MVRAGSGVDRCGCGVPTGDAIASDDDVGASTDPENLLMAEMADRRFVDEFPVAAACEALGCTGVVTE